MYGQCYEKEGRGRLCYSAIRREASFNFNIIEREGAHPVVEIKARDFPIGRKRPTPYGKERGRVFLVGKGAYAQYSPTGKKSSIFIKQRGRRLLRRNSETDLLTKEGEGGGGRCSN